MWSGSVSNIPENYALCDGTNDTPNLKGRFIVGYDPDDTDYNAPRKTGGEKTHTLTVNEMPSHQHTYQHVYEETGEVRHDGSDSIWHIKNETYHTGNQGGGQPHENRPPYYVLAFIMRKK